MHTKGPWTVVGNQIVSTHMKTPIALVATSSTEKEQADNAALLAAAPELLTELERLIYILNKLSEWEDHTEKARAIVLKTKSPSS